MITREYSGILIDQNQIPGPDNFVTLTDDWFYQQFYLPEKFEYGIRGVNERWPSLSGFQLLVAIPAKMAFVASLNWRIEYYVVGVGWTLLEQGSTTGCHAEGEHVWMDIFFPNPVEMSEILSSSSFRIGFQGFQNISKVWYATPNPLPNSEAYNEETGLGFCFNFRLLGMIADSGTDFMGNPYRSIAVESVADNTDASDSAWRSSPQPSKFAVVSNYFDVRANPTYGLINLVPNPSFEYGLQFWGTKSYFLSGDSSKPLKLTTEDPLSGKSALLVETEGGSNEGAAMIFPDLEPFIAKRPYTASVYLRSTVAKSEGLILTFGWGTDFAELKEITLGEEWQRFSVTWVPANSHASDGTTGEKGVSISIRTGSADVSSFYVDATQVTITSEPTPYIDGDLTGNEWTGLSGQSASVEVNRTYAVVDSVLVDPQTPNVSFSVYYSTEGDADEHTTTEEWEQKLWTRVPQTFIATHRQKYYFPEPIKASFLKIEYSNLQAQNYNPGDFAKPVTYKKFPVWVTDFFIAQMELPSFIANTVGVSYDALEFAYSYYLDDLKQEPAQPIPAASEIATLDNFFNNSDASNLVDPGTLAQINLIMNTYTAPPAAQSDPSTLLGQAQERIALSQTNYPTEATPEQEAQNLANVSRLNRENIVFEQSRPIMFFFLTCRHAYKELTASFEDNRAYFVAINEISFMRSNYTTSTDDELYIESGGDTVNIERNDFVIHDDGTWTSY